MDADKLKAAVTARQPYGMCFNSFVKRAFIEGFEQGVKWLMSLPLSDRLTDEEKEKIRAIYKDYEELETYGEALSDRTAGRMQCFTLEQIFGKELFNEK